MTHTKEDVQVIEGWVLACNCADESGKCNGILESYDRSDDPKDGPGKVIVFQTRESAVATARQYGIGNVRKVSLLVDAASKNEPVEAA